MGKGAIASPRGQLAALQCRGNVKTWRIRGCGRKPVLHPQTQAEPRPLRRDHTRVVTKTMRAARVIYFPAD